MSGAASPAVSSVRKRSARRMQPYLITSPMPSAKKSGGSVASVSGSMSTKAGWWNAPARFLPCGRSTAVFPPTEESTCASSEVGTCTKRMPRR